MKAVNKYMKVKENFTDNHLHNILRLEQIILSPQVEGSVFVNNKLAYMSCLASCQRTSDLGS